VAKCKMPKKHKKHGDDDDDDDDDDHRWGLTAIGIGVLTLICTCAEAGIFTRNAAGCTLPVLFMSQIVTQL
jgi:hypothetical protein